MEKRLLIAIGIDGNPISHIPTYLNAELTPCNESERQLLLFGPQVRKENDAEHALRFACEQTDTNRRMVVKEVFVDVEELHKQPSWDHFFGKEIRFTIVGETLVDSSIAKIYDRLFLFEKTFENDEELFFLRGERQRPNRLRGLTPTYSPLIGRKNELARLYELVEQIQEDQGQIVSVVGEAGIGKSRLIAEVKQYAKEKGIFFSEGAFSPHSTFPYEGVRKLIQGMVHNNSQTFTRWAMEDVESDFIRMFLNPGTPVESLRNMTEEQLRQGLFSIMKKIVHRAAAQPFVLCLEDLHWADASSMELINYMLEGIEERKLLALFAHRPEYKSPWSQKLNYTEIRLHAFGTDEIKYFVSSLLKADGLSAKLKQEVERISKGNPLYVEELIRQLTETHQLKVETDHDGKRYARTGDKDFLDIPNTLQNLISSRIDQLPPMTRDVLRWASLFGSLFYTDEVTSFLNHLNIPNSSGEFLQLQERNFIFEKSLFPRKVSKFTHDLIYEVIQRSFSENDRKEKQTQIAQFLKKAQETNVSISTDAIAQHFLEGNASDESIEFILRAAKANDEAHQFQRAVTLYKGAYAHWTQIKPKLTLGELFIPYLETLIKVGNFKECEEVFQIWEKKGVGELPRFKGTHAYLRTLFFNSSNTNYQMAFEFSEIALNIFKNKPEFESLFYKTINERVLSLLNLGRNKEAQDEAMGELQKIDKTVYPNQKILLLARLAHSISLTGHPEKAIGFLEEAEKMINEKTPPFIQMEIIHRYTPTLARLGRYKETIAKYSKLIDIAKENGYKQFLARAYLNRGIQFMEDGDFQAAFIDYKSAEQLADEIHDQETPIRAISGHLDGLLDIGVGSLARQIWNLHSAKLLASHNNWYLAVVHAAYGSLLELENHFERAAAEWKTAEEFYIKVGHKAAAGRSWLYKTRIEIQYDLIPIETITKNFNIFAVEELKNNWTDNRFQIFGTAMMIAAKGGKPIGLDLNLKPSDCPVTWLKQFVYVANILYLDFQNKKQEATQLRKEYENARLEIARRIPLEFHDDFFKHPVYRVP